MNRNDVETASGCAVSDSWMLIHEGQSSDKSKDSQEGYYGAETGHVECLIEQLQSNLMEQQKGVAGEFIRHNADVFSASEFDSGCTSLVEHTIELTTEKPVRQALRLSLIHI